MKKNKFKFFIYIFWIGHLKKKTFYTYVNNATSNEGRVYRFFSSIFVYVDIKSKLFKITCIKKIIILSEIYKNIRKFYF